MQLVTTMQNYYTLARLAAWIPLQMSSKNPDVRNAVPDNSEL